MKHRPNKMIGLRLPNELAKKAEDVVKREFSGLSEYVRHLVRADLAKRGMLEPQAEEVGA